MPSGGKGSIPLILGDYRQGEYRPTIDVVHRMTKIKSDAQDRDGLSARLAILVVCVLLVCPTVYAADEDRPTGTNCELLEPPAAAGEEFGHGFLLRVWPRAKDIDVHYTGCQVVLATKDGKTWRVAWLTEIIKGDPVRIWFEHPDSNDFQATNDLQACRYKSGKLVRGDPHICHGLTLVGSRAPGCTERFGKGAPAPECEEWDVEP